MSREIVASMARRWKANGESIALASGAFDLLHVGHLAYLEALRFRSEKLIVAVMSDRTVALKAPGRPIIPEMQRLELVDVLRCVDAAFIFDEIGDDKNLEIIRPDIFGRGDGHDENMAEKATLDRLGIKVVLIHTPRITSTTEIIQRIRQ